MVKSSCVDFHTGQDKGIGSIYLMNNIFIFNRKIRSYESRDRKAVTE